MKENTRRMSVSVPAELEERIVSLRKRDEFCRLTISEIVRMLIQKGLEVESPAT